MIELNLQVFGETEMLRYYSGLPKKIQSALRGSIQRAARILRRQMVAEVPEVSGTLRRSIRMLRKGDFVWNVGPTTVYGLIVEEGRSPGRRPPPLSSTRFQNWLKSKGIPRRQWYRVAKYIGEHGTQPNPYMSRSFEEVTNLMFDEVQRAVDKAISHGG